MRRSTSVFGVLLILSCVSCYTGVGDFEGPDISARQGEAGCGPESNDWPSNLIQDIGFALANVDASVAAPVNENVGTLPGESSISGGTASYRIPIQVPPGRAGLQPDVALVYGSQSGNGTAGVGWSLSAGHRIHRCPRTAAQDGKFAPVSFTNSDRLCLDGQRLVRIGGQAYGLGTAEYTTELDSYVRITQTGALSSTSSCFTAEAKDGTISTFGSCDGEGVLDTLGSSQPHSWALTEVRDRHSNKIQYSYQSLSGQHLLSAIDYTVHDWLPGNGRRVEFTYEERPDDDISFAARVPVPSLYRLSAIRTVAPQSNGEAATAMRYELDYKQSDATGRSLLEQVRQCAAASKCTAENSLPPTRFEYETTTAPRFVQVGLGLDPIRESDRVVSDFDGDGTRDRVRHTANLTSKLWLSSGFQIALQQTPWRPGLDPNFGGMLHRDSDFDNDGIADLTGSVNGFFAIASWNANTSAFDQRVSNLPYAWPSHALVDRADFNGDGLTDLLIKEAGKFTVHLQCDDGDASDASMSFCETLDRGTAHQNDRVAMVSDFDGNGVPDLFFQVNQTAPGVCIGCISPLIRFGKLDGGYEDASFGEMSAIAPDIGDADYKFGDVNGDRLLDIIRLSGDPSAANDPLTIYVNRGGTFKPGDSARTLFDPQTVAGASFKVPRHVKGSTQVVDVDGDGKDELVMPARIHQAWCADVGIGTPEPITYCASENGYDGPDGTDRSVYAWDIIDIDIGLHSGGIAPASASAKVRPAGFVAPAIPGITPGDRNGDGTLDFDYTIIPSYFPLQRPHAECNPYIEACEGDSLPSGYYQGPSPTGVYAAFGQHRGGDLLTKVTNGLGASESFAYSSLASGRGHTSCPTADDRPFYATEPVHETGKATVASSLHVIARHEHDNGVGGRNATCFYYRNGRRDTLGRGFEGFEEITVVEQTPGDESNDLAVVTEYELDWPTTGPSSQRTYLASDDASASPLAEMQYTYRTSCRQLLGSLEACRVQQTQSTEIGYDLDTRAELSRIVNTITFDSQNDWKYGNPSTQLVRTSDPLHTHEVLTETSWRYDTADVDGWWIDRMDDTTVTYSAMTLGSEGTDPQPPGGDLSVTTTYVDYHEGIRMPKTVTVQDGVATQQHTSRRFYDAYGNTTILHEWTGGSDGLRATTFTYTPDRYFVQSETNAEGHVVRSEDYDARFGLPTKTKDAHNNVTTIAYDNFGRTIEINAPGVQPVYTGRRWCAANESLGGVDVDGNCPENAVQVLLTRQAGAPPTAEFLDVLGRPVRKTRMLALPRKAMTQSRSSSRVVQCSTSTTPGGARSQ